MAGETNLALAVEERLGSIKETWKFLLNESKSKYYVVEFENLYFHAIRFFGTIGFSEFEQLALHNRKPIYQEFVISIEKRFNCDWVVGALHEICSKLNSNKNGVSRGDIVGPFGPLRSETEMWALYATYPFFLEEHLLTMNVNSKKRVISWLIPIYSSEVEYVKMHGWPAFERLLEANMETLSHLDRKKLA